MKWLLVGMLIFANLGISAAVADGGGRTLYVKAEANGVGDGSSWADAFPHLHDAIMAATEGDRIWIATGTYIPTGNKSNNDARSVHFKMKNGVAIYGGFAGDEPANYDLSQRNFQLNKTILSGDLEGNDVLNKLTTYNDNAYHVFFHDASNLNHTAILDGVTITGGNANGTNKYGGGMYNVKSSPYLSNVEIVGNFADSSGAGLYNSNMSSPILINTKIQNNSSNVGGGGVYNRQDSSPVFIQAIISGNSANQGAGIYNGVRSTATIINGLLTGNRATEGGGALFSNTGGFTLINTTISGNLAKKDSGGIYITGTNKNVASLQLSNSIVVGNEAGVGNDIGDLIIGDNMETVIIENSIIGEVNPSTLFVAPVAANKAPTIGGDYRLKAGAPAIDYGKMDFFTSAVSDINMDLDGNPRVSGTEIDLGPYEYQHKVEIALSINLEAAGEVIGAGTYPYGSEVTLEARAMEGYTFTHWVEEGNTVTDSVYTFVAKSNRSFIAVFERVYTEPVPDPNPTPDPAPDPTPDPTPDPSPDPTLDPAPDPTPDPTPEPNPAPERPISPAPIPTYPDSAEPIETQSNFLAMAVNGITTHYPITEIADLATFVIDLQWEGEQAQVELPYETIVQLYQINPDLVLMFQLDSIAYHLPVAEIYEQLKLAEAVLNGATYTTIFTIRKIDDAKRMQFERAVRDLDTDVLVDPVQFTFTLVRDGAEHGGENATITISEWTDYVTRSFVLQNDIPIGQIVGVRYDHEMNRFEAIPTTVEKQGEGWLVQLHSRSNSFYGVLRIDDKFDVEMTHHWAHNELRYMTKRWSLYTGGASLPRANDFITASTALSLFERALDIRSGWTPSAFHDRTMRRDAFLVALHSLYQRMHSTEKAPLHTAEINDVDAILRRFNDYADITHSSKEAMAFAVHHQLIRGNHHGYLLPNVPITYAEANVILYRLLQFMGLANKDT